MNYRFLFIALVSFGLLTSCKKEISGDKDTKPAIKIGDEVAGGLVFYIDSSGEHGLVSAKSGLGIEGEWGCMGDSIVGTKPGFGTGQANTRTIIEQCSTPGIAARLADDLVYNGYSDWYLPSKDELNLMFSYRDLLEFFTGDLRFSSSQIDKNYAWGNAFTSTSQGSISMTKSLSRKIRPIRAF